MKLGYQRIHIDKVLPSGLKQTTVSIESLSYEFLCLKMDVEPYSRESHRKIREWITEKMKTDPVYDPDGHMFSNWLKRTIIFEIADSNIVEKWYDQINQG